MARKAGQLISRRPRTWLVRVSLGRGPETGTLKYHKTIRDFVPRSAELLERKVQEREIGRLRQSRLPNPTKRIVDSGLAILIGLVVLNQDVLDRVR